MAPLSIVLVAVVAALGAEQVSAYPRLFAEKIVDYACSGPTQGYEDHGAPEQTADLLFSLQTADGTPVETWTPGTAYALQVQYLEFGNLWLHTTSGALASGTDAPGTAVVKCNSQAWYSDENRPDQTKVINWTAPPCCEGTEIAAVEPVTFSATWATGQSATYMQADTTMQPDTSACPCGAAVPAPVDAAVPAPVDATVPAPVDATVPATVAAPAPATVDAAVAAPAPAEAQDATVEAAAAVAVVPASAHAMSVAGLTAVASAVLALALL